MKKDFLKLSLLVFMAVMTAYCSKGDDGNPPVEDPSPFVAAINGQQFVPSALPSAEMSNSGRFIVLNATNTTAPETIRLDIGDFNGNGPELAVGTYNIVTNPGTSISYFVDGNTYIANDNGQIVITSLDIDARKISGTFLGTVSGSFGTNGSFTITNGEFTDITFSIL